MATPISRWFQVHVTDPLDRLYERVDTGLGIDPGDPGAVAELPHAV